MSFSSPILKVKMQQKSTRSRLPLFSCSSWTTPSYTHEKPLTPPPRKPAALIITSQKQLFMWYLLYNEFRDWIKHLNFQVFLFKLILKEKYLIKKGNFFKCIVCVALAYKDIVSKACLVKNVLVPIWCTLIYGF